MNTRNMRENDDEQLYVRTDVPEGRSHSSFMTDGYIRALFFFGALAIIGALLTMVFALVSGVIDLDSTTPRTFSDYNEAQALARIRVAQSAEGYGQLALSQIANGKLVEAEVTIQEGRMQTFEDEERNQYLTFAEASLAEAKGDIELAIQKYEETMSLLLDAYTTMLESSASPNWAIATGLHPNYYDSAYTLALLYGDKGDFQKKLELLDVVLEGRPTAGDVLVDRGNAKLELEDTSGAIEDFNAALRFLPDDEFALDGLRRAEGK